MYAIYGIYSPGIVHICIDVYKYISLHTCMHNIYFKYHVYDLFHSEPMFYGAIFAGGRKPSVHRCTWILLKLISIIIITIVIIVVFNFNVIVVVATLTAEKQSDSPPLPLPLYACQP